MFRYRYNFHDDLVAEKFAEIEPIGWPAHNEWDPINHAQFERATKRAAENFKARYRACPKTEILEQRLANRLEAAQHSLTQRDVDLRNGR